MQESGDIEALTRLLVLSAESQTLYRAQAHCRDARGASPESHLIEPTSRFI
jgi:hypothetical protein